MQKLMVVRALTQKVLEISRVVAFSFKSTLTVPAWRW
jgi:hypothetical protein